jgi:serine/threonine-protein kinase
LASLAQTSILADRMGESRSDRPTSFEYGPKDGERSPLNKEQPLTTVRSAGDEHPTLRLGSAPATEGVLPSWRSRYEDLGELARGGMSMIHTVFDRVVRRRVAMKVHDSVRDPSGLPHFLEEARITGQLDHPHIVPVHDVQYDEHGLPTRFTMKLIEGETLADQLERRGPKILAGDDVERLLGVFTKVCDAIAFAHSRGVIHCDLKPTNILIGSHGQVYVTDWGVALRREQGGDDEERPTHPIATGSLCGTPAYMAPEQAWGRQRDIDERTDVYGLGGVLYAMLTLHPPHDGGSTAADLELAKRGFVARPQDVVRDRALPPGLCRIAMRALAADPAQRYPSVELLKAEIARFLRGGGWFEHVRLPKGTLIVREGDIPDAAYILFEGKCELFRVVDGERRTMRVLTAGEVFGETSIFGSSVRTASIQALTEVTLIRVTRDALQRELERTEWLKNFVERLAERYIELDAKVRELEKRLKERGEP